MSDMIVALAVLVGAFALLIGMLILAGFVFRQQEPREGLSHLVRMLYRITSIYSKFRNKYNKQLWASSQDRGNESSPHPIDITCKFHHCRDNRNDHVRYIDKGLFNNEKTPADVSCQKEEVSGQVGQEK